VKLMPSLPMLALPLVLSACMVGPGYQKPALDLPDRHRTTLAAGEGAALADIAWFELFADPLLEQLIATALRQNLDLRQALGRVLENRQRARLAGAGPYPDIIGSLSSTPAPGSGDSDTNFSSGIALGWELDLFGKLRRAIEAADAEALATEEGARAVTVSLVAAVTSTYFLIQELDRRVGIVQRTIASQTQSLELVRSLKQSGVVSAAEENQALSLLASSKAQLPALQQARTQAENALAFLLGLPPLPQVPPQINVAAPDLPTFTVDLPTELLTDRPDVRAAEQRLHAATARVGVAIANRFPFPTIGLTGFAGRFSTSLDDLIDGGTDLSSWGPTVSVPLLDFGRTKAGVRIADAQLIQAGEAYRAAVLGALREVADALIGYQSAADIIEHNRTRTAAAAQVLKLQRMRFKQGVVAFLEVLDAERQLLAAELALAQAEFGRVQQFVDLYRALGGGADEQRLSETLTLLQNNASAQTKSVNSER